MTQQPPIQPTPVGAFRFNTDSAKLEYFDGNQYVNITTDSPEANTGGTRGIIAGGRSNGSGVRHIQFVNMANNGNFPILAILQKIKEFPYAWVIELREDYVVV